MSLPETRKGKAVYVGPDEILSYFRLRLSQDPESDYYKGIVKQLEDSQGIGGEKEDPATDSTEEQP